MGTLGQWLVRTLRENWFFLLIVSAIVLAFLWFRTPASAVSSVAEVDTLLKGGQPTLLELYSNT